MTEYVATRSVRKDIVLWRHSHHVWVDGIALQKSCSRSRNTPGLSTFGVSGVSSLRCSVANLCSPDETVRIHR